MTKKITLTLVLVIFIAFAFNVLAQGRELEVKYPEVQGEKPEETTAQVPEYVKYIFNFLIGISGVIALGALIYAGFQWFTSAGSPEKIQNSKDQISAALLGLLILFGSYLILTTINPDLVVFKLKRLRPIISELPAGVLLCNGQVEAHKAWLFVYEFKFQTPSEEREKQIKEELDKIIDKVNLKCTRVVGAGEVKGDVQFIYFIPDIKIGKDGMPESTTEYGAIIYEDSNFEGKSNPFYQHLLPGGMITVYEIGKKDNFPNISPSSIKPFILIPKHDGGYERDGVKYQVFLFQEYNRNIGTDLEDKGKMYGLLPENWWHEYDDITNSFRSLTGARCTEDPESPEKNYCSPRSIQVLGDYIAILITPDGRNDTFYNEIDNNLDDNLNIVNWVKCKSYQSKKTKPGPPVSGSFGGVVYGADLCAQPAVRKLVIISAKVY